jgi:CBS domain-containing protein
MSLLRQGKAQALTIYLGESDQWHGMPLYVALVQLLREQGCAGATATRAVAGYGAGGRIHESGHMRLSSDATIVIQVIDQPERLRRLLPRLQEMISGGLITLQEVDVLKYTHAQRRGVSAKLPVRQVMETQVTTVQLDTPVTALLDLLLEAPFRALPVIDRQRRLQGIISTGDLITANVLPMRRGLLLKARELDSETLESVETPLEQVQQDTRTAQDVMNQHVHTIRPNATIREAARLMVDTGVRRLPVVETDGILMGMLTRADLLRVVVTSPLMSADASSATQPLRISGQLSTSAALPPQQRPISDYIQTTSAIVNEQASLDEVIDALTLSPLKRVLVVDMQQHIKGIISDVDVLSHLQADMRPGLLAFLTGKANNRPKQTTTRSSNGPTNATTLMNPNVVTIAETATIQETIERMLSSKRKILPVVNVQNRLKGVVGRNDLLRVLIEG